MNYQLANYYGYNYFFKENAEKFSKFVQLHKNCEIELINKNDEHPLIKSFNIFMKNPTIENAELLPICEKKLILVDNIFNININN